MRLLRAKKSVKKVWQQINFGKVTSNLVENLFFISEIIEPSNPLPIPTLKYIQIHVKTRKKCISDRFQAK